MGDMRSVPEPSSAVGGPATGRDPWAGFGDTPDQDWQAFHSQYQDIGRWTHSYYTQT